MATDPGRSDVGPGSTHADAREFDDDATASLTEAFAAERARLVGLAYRITGSRLDAEDIVQEAWLRACRADWTKVERPAAWLTTVVSRLALDELRSARRRREEYVGPWLPEPVRTPQTGAVPEPADKPSVDLAGTDPATVAELAESLTFGFIRLLEALTPIQRVVFLLAEVFETPYSEVAVVVDRSPETCRQIARRARQRVRDGRVPHDPVQGAAEVTAALLVAVAAGDVDRVVSLMAEDVVVVSDGGAEALAARRPVRGAFRATRYLVNLAGRFPNLVPEAARINDEPGVVLRLDGRPMATVAVHVLDGRAHAIHIVTNPHKLAALDISTPIV